MTVKIPTPKDEDLTPELKEYVDSMPPLNLVRMLCNAPASIKEFNSMGGTILFKSEFDASKREIAVLRIAHITKSAYEWHHHVAFGKRVGLTDEEIEKIACDGPVETLIRNSIFHLICLSNSSDSRNFPPHVTHLKAYC